MKKKYTINPVLPDNNSVNEPATEYQTKRIQTILPIHSLEEVKEKLIKSEEDLTKGIYTTHEEMKKRHL